MRPTVGEMKDRLSKGIDIGNDVTSIELQGVAEGPLRSQRKNRLWMVLSECLLDKMDQRERD